jgi:prepilin-type N-terminal cleavage/methylation domain-containing protein
VSAYEKEKGFTLVEISIVVFIVALLTALGSHMYSELRLDAKADAFVNELKLLESAARMYYYEHNGAKHGGYAEKDGDISVVSSYLPEGFSAQPNCVGGKWWYFKQPGILIVVCDYIAKEVLPIVERAMEKMIKTNPQNRDRFHLFSRGGALLTLDYALEHNGGNGEADRAVSSLF